jgi:hypothetical protein
MYLYPMGIPCGDTTTQDILYNYFSKTIYSCTSLRSFLYNYKSFLKNSCTSFASDTNAALYVSRLYGYERLLPRRAAVAAAARAGVSRRCA